MSVSCARPSQKGSKTLAKELALLAHQKVSVGARHMQSRHVYWVLKVLTFLTPFCKTFLLTNTVYSFECNESNLDYYRRHIKLLKKRVPYFYIPDVTHFAFSSQIDDEFNMQFDVLVKNGEKVLQVCYSLLNQIISILSFED